MTVRQDWLDAVTTSRRVLVPITNIREQITGVWTNYDSPGNGYSITWLSQTHDGDPKSAYRSITGIQVNDGGLTYQPNSLLVSANAGSWYWDAATSVLYVQTPTGAAPNTFTWVAAIFEMYFASDVLAADALWEPRVIGALPTISAEETDLTLGLKTSMSGVLQLNNADGFFDDLSVKYRWHNAQVTVLLGGGAMAVADYYSAGVLQITGLPAAGDALCVFQLRDFDNQIRNRAFPLHVYEDYFDPSDFSLMPATLEGQFMPMVWGTVSDIPVTYIRANGLWDRYLIIDPIQASSGVDVSAVYATSRTTGEREVVDPIDYVSASYYVEVFRSSYATTDYTFTVDCSRTATFTAGTLALDILDWIGVPAADIDTASFTAADARWPAEMGLYVAGGSSPRVFVSCSALFNQIEASSLGRITLGADGLWTMSIYDPSVPASAPTIYAELLTTFEPVSEIQEPMALTMRVQYGLNVKSGQWRTVSASRTGDGYGYQTVETLTHPTLLVNEGDADTLAQRLIWINSIPTTRIEIDGPPSLFTLMPRDKVRVIRDRAPSVTGSWSAPGEGMEIERIDKRPGDCRASATIGNMRGVGNLVKTVAPNGTAAYGSASDLEKSAYAFVVATGVPTGIAFGRVW